MQPEKASHSDKPNINSAEFRALPVAERIRLLRIAEDWDAEQTHEKPRDKRIDEIAKRRRES
jgi:hypothetical protein